MISPIELKRRLHRESHFWKRREGTPFIAGIVHGLQIAIGLVDALAKGYPYF